MSELENVVDVEATEVVAEETTAGGNEEETPAE